MIALTLHCALQSSPRCLVCTCHKLASSNRHPTAIRRPPSQPSQARIPQSSVESHSSNVSFVLSSLVLRTGPPVRRCPLRSRMKILLQVLMLVSVLSRSIHATPASWLGLLRQRLSSLPSEGHLPVLHVEVVVPRRPWSCRSVLPRRHCSLLLHLRR